MKVEEIIKATSSLTAPKKALLSIIYTQNVISEKMYEILKPFDISSEQFNVLRILRGQKGKPVNLFEIQERMIAKSSNTTRLIDKLLLKELVNRKTCPANRRKIEVTITDKGMKLLEELDPKVLEIDNLFASNLTNDELIQLSNLLEKYRTI